MLSSYKYFIDEKSTNLGVGEKFGLCLNATLISYIHIAKRLESSSKGENSAYIYEEIYKQHSSYL